jgi:hypothetical protein
VNWTARNDGPGEAEGPWVDHIYLSPTGTLANATLLRTVAHSGDLGSGLSESLSSVVVVPSLPDGAYKLLILTDAAHQVFEGGGADENNNSLVATADLVLGHANLVPAFTSAATQGTSGSTLSIEWSVSNEGLLPALGSWIDRVYLSTDSMLSAGDRLLGEWTQTGPLAPQSNYPAQITATLPIELSGPFFLLGVTDAANAVHELGDEADNIAVHAIQVDLAPYADLVASG